MRERKSFLLSFFCVLMFSSSFPLTVLPCLLVMRVIPFVSTSSHFFPPFSLPVLTLASSVLRTACFFTRRPACCSAGSCGFALSSISFLSSSLVSEEWSQPVREEVCKALDRSALQRAGFLSGVTSLFSSQLSLACTRLAPIFSSFSLPLSAATSLQQKHVSSSYG